MEETKNIMLDFLNGLKEVTSLKTGVVHLRKLQNKLKKLSHHSVEANNGELLMECILKYIDYIINVASNRNFKDQLKICKKSFDIITEIVSKDVQNIFTKKITKRVFDIIIEDDVQSWCIKKELLKAYISCIQSSDKSIRQKAVAELPDIYLFKMVDTVSTYGDYDFQVTLIETVFRMYGKSRIMSKLKDLIPESQQLSESFADINGETFDEDVRKFLNALNETSGKVFSVVCRNVHLGNIRCGEPMANIEGLWVDFNLSENAISWYCSKSSFNTTCGETESTDEDNMWNLITLLASNVENVQIHRPIKTEDVLILFKLKEPCISSFEDNQAIVDTADNLKLIVSYKADKIANLLSKVLPSLFKNKFHHNSTKVSSTKKAVYKPLNISVSKRNKPDSTKAKSDSSSFLTFFAPSAEVSSKSDINSSRGDTSDKRINSLSSLSTKCEVISIPDSSMAEKSVEFVPSKDEDIHDIQKKFGHQNTDCETALAHPSTILDGKVKVSENINMSDLKANNRSTPDTQMSVKGVPGKDTMQTVEKGLNHESSEYKTAEMSPDVPCETKISKGIKRPITINKQVEIKVSVAKPNKNNLSPHSCFDEELHSAQQDMNHIQILSGRCSGPFIRCSQISKSSGMTASTPKKSSDHETMKHCHISESRGNKELNVGKDNSSTENFHTAKEYCQNINDLKGSQDSSEEFNSMKVCIFKDKTAIENPLYNGKSESSISKHNKNNTKLIPECNQNPSTAVKVSKAFYIRSDRGETKTAKKERKVINENHNEFGETNEDDFPNVSETLHSCKNKEESIKTSQNLITTPAVLTYEDDQLTQESSTVIKVSKSIFQEGNKKKKTVKKTRLVNNKNLPPTNSNSKYDENVSSESEYVQKSPKPAKVRSVDSQDNKTSGKIKTVKKITTKQLKILDGAEIDSGKDAKCSDDGNRLQPPHTSNNAKNEIADFDNNSSDVPPPNDKYSDKNISPQYFKSTNAELEENKTIKELPSCTKIDSEKGEKHEENAVTQFDSDSKSLHTASPTNDENNDKNNTSDYFQEHRALVIVITEHERKMADNDIRSKESKSFQNAEINSEKDSKKSKNTKVITCDDNENFVQTSAIGKKNYPPLSVNDKKRNIHSKHVLDPCTADKSNKLENVESSKITFDKINTEEETITEETTLIKSTDVQCEKLVDKVTKKGRRAKKKTKVAPKINDSNKENLKVVSRKKKRPVKEPESKPCHAEDAKKVHEMDLEPIAFKNKDSNDVQETNTNVESHVHLKTQRSFNTEDISVGSKTKTVTEVEKKESNPDILNTNSEKIDLAPPDFVEKKMFDIVPNKEIKTYSQTESQAYSQETVLIMKESVDIVKTNIQVENCLPDTQNNAPQENVEETTVPISQDADKTEKCNHNVMDYHTEKRIDLSRKNDCINLTVDNDQGSETTMKSKRQLKYNKSIIDKTDCNQTLSTTLGERKRRKLYNPEDLTYLQDTHVMDDVIIEPAHNQPVSDEFHSINKSTKQVKEDDLKKSKRPRKDVHLNKHRPKPNKIKKNDIFSPPKRLKIVNPEATLKLLNNEEEQRYKHLRPVFYNMVESFRKQAGTSFADLLKENTPKEEKRRKGSTKTNKRKYTKRSVKANLKADRIVRAEPNSISLLSSCSLNLNVQESLQPGNVTPPMMADEMSQLPHLEEKTQPKINIISNIQIRPKRTLLQDKTDQVEKKKRKTKQFQPNANFPQQTIGRSDYSEQVQNEYGFDGIVPLEQTKEGPLPIISKSITNEEISSWIATGSTQYDRFSEKQCVLKHAYPMFTSLLNPSETSQEHNDVVKICNILKKYI